jgi:hypothetical protein
MSLHEKPMLHQQPEDPLERLTEAVTVARAGSEPEKWVSVGTAATDLLMQLFEAVYQVTATTVNQDQAERQLKQLNVATAHTITIQRTAAAFSKIIDEKNVELVTNCLHQLRACMDSLLSSESCDLVEQVHQEDFTKSYRLTPVQTEFLNSCISKLEQSMEQVTKLTTSIVTDVIVASSSRETEAWPNLQQITFAALCTGMSATCEQAEKLAEKITTWGITASGQRSASEPCLAMEVWREIDRWARSILRLSYEIRGIAELMHQYITTHKASDERGTLYDLINKIKPLIEQMSDKITEKLSMM